MDRARDLAIREHPDGALLRVKAVPGASRDRIAGVLGDALKVAVSAPAEKGKANKALARTLAEALGVPSRAVSVHAGQDRPRKEFLVEGMGPPGLRRRLEAL